MLGQYPTPPKTYTLGSLSLINGAKRTDDDDDNGSLSGLEIKIHMTLVNLLSVELI